MRIIIVCILIMLLSGCVTRTRTTTRIEYFDTGEVFAEETTEEVEEGFTLGTQGFGTYNIFPVSLF